MKRFFPFLLVILTIPATFFLLRPGQYWNMHDDMQMVRQLQLEKCLLDGQIPCRWSPDLGYGYGYPLFNFYPPMPYLVGQIFRFLGFSFVDTVKLTAITQILASSAATYLLVSSLLGPLSGIFSAVFYTYAPYHALNIFVRGAMNEAWAAVFFPLIFHFSRLIIKKPTLGSLVLLSLSFSGLLLSHNPMALIFVPFLFFWCLYWFLKNPVIKTIIYLTFSGLLAISLSAFFTIPILFETKFVQIESMFQNYYHFSVHFVSLFQLFISNFWGDGASVWGPEDNMSFMVGYLHWLVPLLLLVYLSLKSFRKKKMDSYLPLTFILFFMGLFSLFMTHNKSTSIWLALPFVQKIQFPWRFLNPALFFLSFSIAPLAKILPKSGLLLIPATILLNLFYFTPQTFGPITDNQKFSGQAWTYQITSGIYDYLPKTARIAAQKPAKDFVDEIIPQVEYQISGQKRGTDWQFFNLNLKNSAKVTLSQMAFPHFAVFDNSQKINYEVEPELGRIVLHLNSGQHQIYLKLQNTPIRTISNLISLTAIIFVLFYFFRAYLWKKI